ncbi:unnamed protein product [Linum trigynum]|uniref:Uncharacterized protein n=1 Tax=Linum trigynum TaxID=586398 RepID=A0AAV2DCC1_9ROSI
MTRIQSGGLLPLDPELERTCHQLWRQKRARLATEERIDGHLSSDSEEEYEMEGEHNPHQGNPLQVPPVNQILGNNPIPQVDGVHHHPLPSGPTLEYYYTPRVADIRLVILYPPIPANNFEIKPCWIQLITSPVQFHGLKDEEARVHLSRFLQLTNGFKLNGVPDDAIRLHLFPHSLAGHAKRSWRPSPHCPSLLGTIWPTSSCTGTIRHRRLQRFSGRSHTFARSRTSHFVMHGSGTWAFSGSVPIMASVMHSQWGTSTVLSLRKASG